MAYMECLGQKRDVLPKSDGLQPKSDGIQAFSVQPRVEKATISQTSMDSSV